MKFDMTKAQHKKTILDLIAEHGSAYAVSKVLDISPQAFYERMDRLGIKRKGYSKLRGEPTGDVTQLRKWLSNKLEGRTVNDVAKKLHCSPSAIRARMQKAGIKAQKKSIFPSGIETKGAKKDWLRGALRDHKNNMSAVARAYGVTPSAVAELVARYIKGKA